ncbi:MAG: ribosomal L7Ae/L30e/S12e/Gadd45 family protein [Oscillospiraceae bacterium]|nr:ribosomal L7Ae/L30e/S12e/Gadd45 family protein [Oscillospiraceae bacterium]
MNKILFSMSLAKKAGKLVSGFDRVKTAVIRGEAWAVILASDLSEKTIKRVNYFCEDIADVYMTSLTQYEFSQVAGRLTGIVTITDENLARLCTNAIKETEGEL